MRPTLGCPSQAPSSGARASGARRGAEIAGYLDVPLPAAADYAHSVHEASSLERLEDDEDGSHGRRRHSPADRLPPAASRPAPGHADVAVTRSRARGAGPSSGAGGTGRGAAGAAAATPTRAARARRGLEMPRLQRLAASLKSRVDLAGYSGASARRAIWGHKAMRGCLPLADDAGEEECANWAQRVLGAGWGIDITRRPRRSGSSGLYYKTYYPPAEDDNQQPARLR